MSRRQGEKEAFSREAKEEGWDLKLSFQRGIGRREGGPGEFVLSFRRVRL